MNVHQAKKVSKALTNYFQHTEAVNQYWNDTFEAQMEHYNLQNKLEELQAQKKKKRY